MVQNLESSNIISPQEMHQRVLMQKMFSYDKDAKTGLSKTELNKYMLDSQFRGGDVPEFAQKLVEKFNEIDQNKDGQISSTEINSLQNYRGLWSVAPLGMPATQGTQSQSVIPTNANDLLSKNIQSLVKRGMDYAKNNPQLITKLEETVHKII